MKKLLTFLCLILVGQAQAQVLRLPWRISGTLSGTITTPATNTSIISLSITYATAPTSPTANFTVLKHNKIACFQYERDDNLLPVYTADYPFFQTKTFTDGAGNPVKWRGSVVVNARNNFNNASWWDSYVGKATTAQVAEMVSVGKWGVLSHSYYHENDSTLSSVKFWAPRTPTMSQSAWNTVENTKYTYQKLLTQGVQYVMRGFVVPTNYAGYIRAADSTGYLGSTSTNNLDGYVGTPIRYTYDAARPGVNFTQYGTLPLTISKFGQAQFSHYLRNFIDNWTVAEVNTLKLQFSDMVNSTVADGKHRLMRLGTHYGTYPSMSNFWNYADSVAADRVWFCGMTEELEYREVRRLAKKTQSLSGNVLTVSLDMSDIPAVNRFRDMSLLVTGGTIASVSSSGPHDRITFNPSTGLINVFWEKTSGFPDPSLLPSGTTLAITGADSVAEGSSQVYRVIATLPNGQTTDITTGATFSSSRGTASGLTLTKTNSVTIAAATNTVRGDNRITTLTAAYQGLSVTREIALADRTTSYTTVAPRAVNSTDISRFSQMKTGDYILQGATLTNPTTGEYAINIQTSQSNVFSVTAGATIWVKGGTYDFLTLQLNTSRVAPGGQKVKLRNYDGQVVIRGNVTILGAQGLDWSGLGGDADYHGHTADYAFTAGRYGFLLDRPYSFTSSTNGVKMDGGVRDIEVSHIEIRGNYFAGFLVNDTNYDMNVGGSTVNLPYENMSFHDLYIHDLHSEGLYLGSTGTEPKAHYKGLSVYNNRVLRVGSEPYQLGKLEKGVNVFNNIGHGGLEWRNPFQDFQFNALQLNVFQAGQLVEKNIFIAPNAWNILTQSNNAPTSADTDSLIVRNNLFWGMKSGFAGYTNTITQTTRQPPIDNLKMLIDGNRFGGFSYQWDQVYSDAINENFLLRFDLLGGNEEVFIRNNIFDGSTSKSTWANSFQSTPITLTGNNLAGSVPAPVFTNYMGGLDWNTLEVWADSVGTDTSNPGAMLLGAPITVPAGHLRYWKGGFYEAKISNTAIEPGVASGWQTYWNTLYWDRKTGAVVRNPSSLSGLSAYPPDDVQVSGIYTGLGIN